MATITKEYTNGEVTIVWKPDLCIHSENCFHGLPEVFDPNKRPWVNAEGASTEKIVETIKKCPSGALSYKMNDGTEASAAPKAEEESGDTVLNIFEDGPIMVEGNFEIKDKAGNVLKKSDKAFLCRCGASQNKPFCDGAHKKIDFKG